MKPFPYIFPEIIFAAIEPYLNRTEREIGIGKKRMIFENVRG
jgi:hypothetical protein